MPKNKKAKTKHYSSKNSGELSQAEIWDDSALIKSWNEAVAEYEYYHSIHARGEDVEEVLRKAEMDELAQGKASNDTAVDSRPPDVDMTEHKAPSDNKVTAGDQVSEEGEIEDGELNDDLQAAKEALAQKVVQGEIAKSSDSTAVAGDEKAKTQTHLDAQIPPLNVSSHPQVPAANPSIGPVLPPTGAEGPSTEQTLENIKMAYYWAGYYSGLYNGQRQAQTQAQPSVQSSGQ